jgi:hypothetical protein
MATISSRDGLFEGRDPRVVMTSVESHPTGERGPRAFASVSPRCPCSSPVIVDARVNRMTPSVPETRSSRKCLSPLTAGAEIG